MKARLHTALAVALLLARAGASLAEPPSAAGAAVRVHDHEAFSFRASDGALTPAQRAAEASQNLSAVIDDGVPGELVVLLQDQGAVVQVGNRQLFRLVPADAQAVGEASLAAYAPRLHTALDSFLSKERRRAQLQNFVLSFSLVVALALLAYLLLRLLYRTSHRWEERLLAADAEVTLRLGRLGLSSERSRAALLLSLNIGRIAAALATGYLLLVFGLSLFEPTRAWSSTLATWATAPFVAFGQRLLHMLPNLLLLLVFWAVLRGGWRAMTVGFDRIAHGKSQVAGLRPELVVPYRLLARAGLVLATFLLLPLLAGSESGLPTQVGMVLLAALALSAVPLAANALLGTYALLAGEYPLGEWVRVRTFGLEIAGEVTLVDFLHLRLVPPEGGEVRLPHLLLVASPVVRLAQAPALVVELPVALHAMPPGRALEALRQAVERVRRSAQLAGVPSVSLRAIDESLAHFAITVPDATDSLRTELLLALREATHGTELS